MRTVCSIVKNNLFVAENPGLGNNSFMGASTQIRSRSQTAKRGIPMPEIPQRAEALGYTIQEVADELATTKRNLEYWIEGRHSPSLPQFGKLCRFLRINPAPMLGASFEGLEDEYERINVYDVSASAGAGGVVLDENAKYQVAFRTDWLRSVSRSAAAKLKVIEVDGDSMAPTLHHGDHLLVDTAQLNPRRDGLYVIDWEGALLVKRVTADPASKTISIASDNPAHRSYDGIDPETVRVVGRVIWIGRRA